MTWTETLSCSWVYCFICLISSFSVEHSSKQSLKEPGGKCNFIVGGEVSVARIHFLSVSLANVLLILNTFYNIDPIYYCELY